MTERLLLLLPAVVDPADVAAKCWRVIDGEVIELPEDADWRDLVRPADGGAGLPLIALAPVAAVRIDRPVPEGETDKQRLGIARAKAVAASMADPSTLHSVAGMVDERPAVALVANGMMLEWLDWLAGHGADPVAIIPAGLLLRPGDAWTAVALGPERMIGKGDLVAADEPALRDALVGEEPIATLAPADVAARLALLADSLPLNLRSGRFARRRLFTLDWRRVRELAALALIIPLLGLAMALLSIGRLEASSDRLDSESARLAAAAIGRQVPANQAVSALDGRVGEVPGASGSPFAVIAAVYQQLQQVPGSSAAAMGWRPDGTLTVTLAATRTEDINRLLAALQRIGYRVTATPRAATSGQAMADVTIRSAA